MDNALEFIRQRDEFAKLCGIELLEAAPGRALARMTVRREHLNGLGVVHGGAVFALADLAFAAISNSGEGVALGVNVSISWLGSAQEGDELRAVARVNGEPKRLGSYEVEVRDQSDRLVAVCQALAYRKRETPA